MLALSRGRQSYTCDDCHDTIPKGDDSLSRGRNYGGGSNGRYCVNCIIETGKILEGNKNGK